MLAFRSAGACAAAATTTFRGRDSDPDADAEDETGAAADLATDDPFLGALPLLALPADA